MDRVLLHVASYLLWGDVFIVKGGRRETLTILLRCHTEQHLLLIHER